MEALVSTGMDAYRVLISLGGVATLTQIHTELRDSGAFDGKSDQDKVTEWERLQISQQLGRQKKRMISSNGKEQSYPAVLISSEGNDRLCMAVNEATAKSHKDVMQTKLQQAYRQKVNRSVQSRGSSYVLRELQGLLFDEDQPPEVKLSPLSGSEVEDSLWKCLQPMDLGLVQQYQAGQFRVDLAQVEKKLLFEVDSYEYHFKAKQQYEKTALRDHYLLENYEVDGWDLKHLHACQIMFDPDKIANQVKQIVLNR